MFDARMVLRGRYSKLCSFLIIIVAGLVWLFYAWTEIEHQTHKRHAAFNTNTQNQQVNPFLYYFRNNVVAVSGETTAQRTSGTPGLPGERNGLHSAQLDQLYAVPNNVFYVWCGSDRRFEFRNYISILSIIHFLQPDNVILYYDVKPKIDKYHYNTWLTEVAERYPFFLKQRAKKACLTKTTFISDQLSKDGGMYFGERVVLTRPGHYLRRSVSVIAMDDENATVVRISAPGQVVEKLSPPNDVVTREALRCVRISSFNATPPAADDGPPCVILDQDIYPKDIWELDNWLGRLLRTIAYGKPDVARPRPSYDELTPNIGHVVWIGGGQMKFDFYLCVLSLLHVAKVDALYIHGQAPTGFYWDLVKTDPRLRVVYRNLDQVYGNRKPSARREHISDICRVDVLLRYGGIYLDVDALFVRPLTREIRGYDAVASKDINTAVYTLYPDHISNGVMIGKPNARFWRLFLESMKRYDDKDYFSIGIRQPYKIKERHPDTLLLDPHLQVLCFDSKCRPTWTPYYQNESFDHRTTDVLRSWRNDTFVFHMTWPTPTEFTSPVALLSADGMIADVGRYVLEQSGVLATFVALSKNETFVRMLADEFQANSVGRLSTLAAFIVIALSGRLLW